ncbi:MAG TPA: hypothetical protein VFR97_04060 [Capillimicrobium sp.]|nr:hypothetical protein [Capillimicrobium sp.]
MSPNASAEAQRSTAVAADRGPAADRWLAVARAAALGLVALAFLVGLVVSLARLIGTADPAGVDVPGWPVFDAAAIDGQSLYLGTPDFLWQDTDDGYTSLGYPPVLPVLTGLLDHVHLWRGWPSLINGLAGLGFVLLLAHTARRTAGLRGRERALAWAEGLGVGAFLWAAVAAAVSPAYFYTDRPDMLTWCFAMAGLLCVPWAARGSRRAMTGAVLLLSAGFLSKQTSLSAPVAAGIWLGVAALLRVTPWRTFLTYCAGMIAVVGTVIALSALATDGWALHFMFGTPSSQGCCELSRDFETYVRLFFQEWIATWLWMLLGAVLVIGIATVAARRAGALRGRISLRRLMGGEVEVQTAVLLVLFGVMALGGAMWARKIYGATQNQSLGAMWALAFLVALAYRSASRRGTRPATLAAGAVVAVVALGQLVSAGKLLDFPRPKLDVAAAASFSTVPPELREFARTRAVYHPFYGDLSVPGETRSISPVWVNMSATLAAGGEMRWVVDGILNRRYDGVFPFNQALVISLINSAGGTQEDNYLWKLNEAMRLKYRPVPGLPDGGRERIPGPDPAPWVQECFGPFGSDDAGWRGHLGGGFWCPTADGFTLRDTPADFSSLRTRQDVGSIGGSVTVELPRGGTAEVFVSTLADGPRFGVQARAVADDAFELRVTDGVDRTPVGEAVRVDGAPLTFHLEPGEGDRPVLGATGRGEVTVELPELPDAARFEIGASKGSDARFDLSALELG